MKKMKTLASLVLALVLAMALTVPAFAAGEGTPATITIQNTSKGETYTAYKLFDAKVNGTGGITYTGDIPTAFEDFFTEGANGQINPVEGLNVGSDAFQNAIKVWLSDKSAKTTYSVQGEGGPVDLDVPYGYYVITSTVEDANGAIVMVDSTNPNATVYDKNSAGTPHFPENGKVVTTATGTKTVAVGETVTYTINYETTNWIDLDGNPANGDEAQVLNYAFKDTLPDFLSDVTVTKVLVTDDNGEHEYKVRDFATGQYIVPQFVENGIKMDLIIPWATRTTGSNYESVYTSNYTNGAKITITYTAVVNEKVLEEGAANHTNTVSATPMTGGGNGTTDTDYETVYTATLNVNKYAANPDDANDKSVALADAQFVLARVNDTVTSDDVDSMAVSGLEYCVIDSANKAVSWTTDKDKATVVTTDAQGAASFAGLTNGTYYLYETKAPDGYNLLTEPAVVEIAAADENTTANISQTTDVPNSTGAVLPSTGGMGTTLFYTIGGLLVVCSAILIVTKKRMSSIA